MKTLDILTNFLKDTANLPHKANTEEELESKKKMKSDFRDHFEWLLSEKNVNPLLAFQVLYHRLDQIAKVAKDVFYDPAIEWVKEHDPDAEGKFFGSKVSLKVSEDYDVIPSPKIKALEKEKDKLEQKHASAIKAYEAYQTDVKSLNNQIKEERQRLIEKGMAKKTGEKTIIALKY